MKKILILCMLLLCAGSTQAVNIQLSKVTANVSQSYTGQHKDTVLKNNAIVTQNILPISFFTFFIKWQGLDRVGKLNDEVLFNVYFLNVNGVESLANSLRHTIGITDENDSTLMMINSYSNIDIAKEYRYTLRLQIIDKSQGYDKLLTLASYPWSYSTIADPNKISSNIICCSKIVSFPFTPVDSLKQKENTTIHTDGKFKITYIWQQLYNGSWIDIRLGTSASYLPGPNQIKGITYRRVAVVNRGLSTESYSISNGVSFSQYVCKEPDSWSNTICNDQAYFNLKNGDIVYPTYLKASDIHPIRGRQRGFQWYRSYDGVNWSVVDPVGDHNYQLANYLEIKPIRFDITKGNVQEIYYYRDFYELYDPWDCGPGKIRFPCGRYYHYLSSSNIVTITLTSIEGVKPVVDSITNETGYDIASCSYSNQTMVFSVPRVNNYETYKWEIPAGWIAHTDLQGAYANSITISTNSGGQNYAKGGNVCLTIKQPGQVNSMCRHITGSEPYTVSLPNVLKGCEGSNIVVKPVILQNNTVQSSANYKFNWEAYQSPNISCNTPNVLNNGDCKELKITIGNVYQNPIQPIKVTATNLNGCTASTTTNLTTSPGLLMGILNNFNDPLANTRSNLALNETSNHLYFTANSGVIQRVYFDNSTNIWRYASLKDKSTNVPISSSGSVAFYKGVQSDKLFYVFYDNLYYAETNDNGLTWTNFNSGAYVPGVNGRIKISDDKIYYIDKTSNKVYYKSLIGLNAAVLVGNIPINYSNDMFTVEEGIVAYADQSSILVAFDAITGIVLPINLTPQLKTVSYNSAISIYNKNIYFVNYARNLSIIQKSSTSSSYTSSQNVSNQLAGPFTINKQTGTVYAKAYDIPGKQIYYLNGQWISNPIKNYDQGSPIQSSMVYGNGHAYYIGVSNIVSNTFYIAPCVPNVLRTSGNMNTNEGDPLNDPIPITREALNVLNIYPNPAKNLVHVNFTTEQASNIQVKVVSLTGSTDIVVEEYVEQGMQDIEIPITEYAAGVYLIQLYVEGELSATSKLITY